LFTAPDQNSRVAGDLIPLACAFASIKNGLHFLLLRTILAPINRCWQPPRSPVLLDHTTGDSRSFSSRKATPLFAESGIVQQHIPCIWQADLERL
jgi:hypothetical protein